MSLMPSAAAQHAGTPPATADATPAPADVRQVWRDALKLATTALDLAETTRRPLDMAMALMSMGRCQRGIGQLETSETTFRKALHWARCCGSVDLEVDVMCELADTSARVGAADGGADVDDARDSGRSAATERARDTAFAASKLAAHVADAYWECAVLLRCAQVLDLCGDTDDARRLRARADAFRATHPVTAG